MSTYEVVGHYTDGRRAVACFADEAEALAFCRANNHEVQADELSVELLLAWINGEDIRAVRDGEGVERLYVDGCEVLLTERDFHATQQVINYAQCGKRDRKLLRALWASRR